MLDREGAKTPKLDHVPPRQRLDDLVEDNVNDPLDVAMIKMVIRSSDFLNELELDHGSASPQLVESHCYYLSFGSLPNGDESVKAQSAEGALVAQQITQPLRRPGPDQRAQSHRRQRTQQPPITLALRLPVLHL